MEAVDGGITVVNSLSREGLITGNIVTTGGLLHVCIYNSTNRVVRLTPTTPLITLFGFHNIEVKRLEPVGMVTGGKELNGEVTEEGLLDEIRRDFSDVCDLSEHPVLPPMARLTIRAAEVTWIEPEDYGQRTPYKMEDNACRTTVEKQLEEYVQKGYLRRVCLSEKVFLSPLLPIAKKDGSYRFTTDFRALNAYFQRDSQEQPDVWRKMWKIEPSWCWYAKLDLKDGFFGVPVEQELQRLFAFSWEGRRYCWRRLPQGWTWSPVLFAERIAQAMEGIDGLVQFADDLLIGAETKEELRKRLLEVFRRLQYFGLKVNLEKATLVSDSITFLGMELSQGRWSLHHYLENKVKTLGRIEHWKDVERIIGVISYARRTIPDVERLLEPVRLILKECKYKSFMAEQWLRFEAFIRALLIEILRRQRELDLIGSQVDSYRIETDWTSNFCGYLLFCERKGQRFLCDLGSKTMVETTSSFVGELKALVWSCKTTKAMRGDVPLIIQTDNHAVARVLNGEKITSTDRRVLRLWGWMIANERYTVDFVPGSTNIGADLLSRPITSSQKTSRKPRTQRKTKTKIPVNVLTESQEARIQQAHAGHFGWYRTLQNLRRQPEGAWPGAKADVQNFVRNCNRCNLYASPIRSPTFTYWKSHWPNEVVHIDFAGPWLWPGSSHAAYILVAIDNFSRFISLYYCHRPTSAVVCRFLRHWRSEYGSPSYIFSDRAAVFTGSRVRELCSRFCIRQVFSARAAHWSNGLCERAIQTILRRIQRHGSSAPWQTILSRVQRDYNRSLHSSTGASPVETFLATSPNGTPLTDDEFAFVLQEAEYRTQQARDRARRRRNKKRQATIQYQIGDRVYVQTHAKPKLAPQWRGPYVITRREGTHLSYVSRDSMVDGPYHAHQLRKAA